MRDAYSRSLVAALAVLVLGFSVSVFGQTVPAAAQSAPGQAAAAATVRRLSVDESVKLALEQNLSLQVQRIDPQVSDQDIVQARSNFAPRLSSVITNSNRKSPNDSALSGVAGDKQTTESFQTNVTAQQLLRWGGSYSVAFDNSRTSNNSIWSGYNPALGSTLTLGFSQPLLRNFRIDTARQQLLVTKKNREISDVQLRQTVLSTVRNVKTAYWDLAYAVASLDVSRQSLDLARESLKNNKARVEIGTMAPIDIIVAEAEVARREEAVILAEAALARAEDRLRTLIFDPSTPGFWTMRLELTDTPTFQEQQIDVDAAVTTALSKRTDLAQAKKSLENNDVYLTYYRDQLLPQVDLQASYALNGQGGTKTVFGEGFPPQKIGETIVGYGDVMSKIFGNDFPTWSLRFNVSYPIGNGVARANLARSRLQYSQAQLQIRNLELSVATQVRDSARQVNTNLKRVSATRVARELSERQLEAEQKKFAAGMSTSFLVFQAQRDLAQARSQELSAILEYNKSLVDFETVQEAPVSGGGITLASSSGGM